MSVGDYIVHIEYGIGVYRGLKRMVGSGYDVECIELEFAKNERVFLPIHRLTQLQKYIGPVKTAPALSQPNGKKWNKLKEKAKQDALKQANELLKLYAQRSASIGYAFSSPENRFNEFENRFPFVETPDQKKAINKIIAEMCQTKPMDHLLCGDVGFTGSGDLSKNALSEFVLPRSGLV